jgi:thymidylate synthase
VHTFGDLHLYANHLEDPGIVDEQLSRTPRPLPQLQIRRRPADLFDYQFEDFDVVGYDPYPPIRAPIAV